MPALSTFWNALTLKRNEEPVEGQTNSEKFGTFLGVFVPCILMLFGVIIFLRLGWIVGVAGLSTTLIIISFSALIALITMLSMAAIATNIEVQNGGIYYILSRSLGIEVGSAVGIPLFFRQSLTIAFCVIGFAESLKDLIPSWDMTMIGISTLSVLTFLAYTSVRGALKVQVAIFIMILASLASLITGREVAAMHPGSFTPEPLRSLGFWAVFTIFFPAMTGVESSVSLSGDLRTPSRSLPIGTIGAILAAFAVYAGIAIFLSYRVPADRLVNDPLIMQDIASVPSLIILGIWGATLSSALGGLLGAPRTLQAIADDGIVPKVFGKTFGAMNEPRIATVATYAVALVGIYFGSINVIAPLLTMISLICYGVLNLSAGMESLLANPSWRPRFIVHWTIPMAGAVLCVVTMLMIDPGNALLSLSIVLLIYFVAKKRQLHSSWVDIRQGVLLFFSRLAIYRLACGKSFSKSWRPHFLVFTKFSEENSTTLLKFSQAISQSKGFLTMASFVPLGEISLEKQKELERETVIQLREKSIQSFVKVKEAYTVGIGMQQMIEHYGLGPLVPNTILFGGIKKEDESKEFVSVLQSAFARHYNLVIMNDDSEMLKEKMTPTKDIHIWWDDQYQDNSELMLVLAYMLQRNPAWKKTRIYVKAVVLNELQKHDKMTQFRQLSAEKRLPVDIEIYVAPHTVEEKLDLVKEFSKNAEIVFMSLAPPPKEAELVDEYVEYLHTLSRTSKGLPSLVLVLSSEHTPLKTILK